MNAAVTISISSSILEGVLPAVLVVDRIGGRKMRLSRVLISLMILCSVRSSLSQFRSRWSGLLPAGPKTRTKLSYAGARFVNKIRLLVMVDGASRRTMSITIGSGFAGVGVSVAEGPSPFCRCFL